MCRMAYAKAFKEPAFAVDESGQRVEETAEDPVANVVMQTTLTRAEFAG